jgi:hypothetical protein
MGREAGENYELAISSVLQVAGKAALLGMAQLLL